jgi:DNA-binding NtrC family response regulator
MSQRVLVIDDDEAVLQSCETILEDAGLGVTLAATPQAGLDLIRQNPFDLVLLDYKLPGLNGLEVLEQACKLDPDVVIIMFTGFGSFESAVQAVKSGAFNYITKPFTSAQLLAEVEKGLAQRRRLRGDISGLQHLEHCCPLHEIVGRSEALQKILATVSKVASSDADVLVIGPSGTGKELIARAIHANGPRRQKPFVPVDCAALPSNLLESELFGHEKGAFTGADQAKRGLLEMANGGTVFFDEIGEMNAELQAKLLRVLQERAFRRVGGEKLIDVSIRVVCCTNRDLEAEARQGRFRQDLLYRLNVVTIALPPLRERAGDVGILTQHFVQKFGRAANKGPVQISPDALQALERHDWPGNVRELRNVLERAIIMCEDHTIRLRDLPEVFRQRACEHLPAGYKAVREQWVGGQGRQYLISLLRRHNGNVSAAAREAQISRKSLYELMHRLEIEPRATASDPPARGVSSA